MKRGVDYQKMVKNYPRVLVFLDFDGVCNSLSDGSYKTTTTETYSFSKPIVERLKSLCDETEAKIVISSNWRRHDEDGYITANGMRYYNPLPKLRRELGDYVFDELPKDRHILKSEALMLWMEDNPGFDGKYVILDDDYRERYFDVPQFKARYVHCDSDYGFTEELRACAKNILDRT